MFEYDRLALDITQQFFTSSSPAADKFYHDLQTEPTNNSNEQENEIKPKVTANIGTVSQPLKSMVESASSTNKRAPTAINGLINGYCQYIQQQQQSQPIFSPRSTDSGIETNRRLSGGSNSYGDCIFDCGASSGYGSPGVAGTPLASPAPNSANYIAHQLQKMLDKEFCDAISPNQRFICGLDQSILKRNAGILAPKLNPSLLPSAPLQNNFGTIGNSINCIDLDDEFVWKKLCFDDDDDFLDQQTVISSEPSAKVNLNVSNKPSCGNDATNQKNNSIVLDHSVSPTLTTSSTPTTTNSSCATAAAIDDGFSVTEIAQFAQLLCSPKKAPPQRYQCHICYQTGHYISDCPMRFNSPYEELTPYQGRKKCYGEFQCQMCKRKWTSQNSVANEAQSCIKCHVPVFPHKQLPVDKAIALGLVKNQRVTPTKITPIGHGRPPSTATMATDDNLDSHNGADKSAFLPSPPLIDSVLNC